MRKKVFIRLSFILFICLIIVSCSLGAVKGEKEIKKLQKMDSYTCNATIKMKNNISTMEYNLKYYYKRNVGFRADVLKPEDLKGQIMVCRGDEFFSYNPEAKHLLKLEKSKDIFGFNMFLGFFQQYLEEYDNAEINVGKFEDYDCVTFELQLTNTNEYMKKMKLFINEKDGLPVKLEIYDEAGEKTAEIIYSEFAVNAKLDKELFKIND